MLKRMTRDEFVEEMMKHDFSEEGLKALFEYLEGDDPYFQFDKDQIHVLFEEYSSIEEFWEENEDRKERWPDLKTLSEDKIVIEFGGEYGEYGEYITSKFILGKY